MVSNKLTLEQEKEIRVLIERVGVTKIIIELEKYCYENDYQKMANHFRSLINKPLN